MIPKLNESLPQKIQKQTHNKIQAKQKKPEKHSKIVKKDSNLKSLDDIPDKEMRKKVCRLLARIIEEKGLEKAKSQDYALILEKKIRAKDPSMQETYKEAFQNMRRQLNEKELDDFIKDYEVAKESELEMK